MNKTPTKLTSKNKKLLLLIVTITLVLYFVDPRTRFNQIQFAEIKYQSIINESIYFVETSSRGYLMPRQACAVESVAKLHPDWQILVIFTAPIINESSTNQLLQLMPNIRIIKIEVSSFLKDTPMATFISSEKFVKSGYPTEHLSEVLRYLLMYMYGGIYLDLDIILIKPLIQLGYNWVAAEDSENIANGAMRITKNTIGQKLIEDTMTYFISKYESLIYATSAYSFRTAILKLCEPYFISKIVDQPERCKGFRVLSPKTFYSVPWPEASHYFEVNGSLSTEGVFGYHVWNKLTYLLEVKKNSPYELLAQTYCPIVYNKLKENI